MALLMTLSSCEQSTVQIQGGGDRYTSVGGGHPPYKISDLLTLFTGFNPPGSENSVIRGPYFLSLVPHNSNPVLSQDFHHINVPGPQMCCLSNITRIHTQVMGRLS